MSKSWNIPKEFITQIVIMMVVLHHGRVEAFGQIKTKSHFSSSSPSCLIKAVRERIRPIDAANVTVTGETIPRKTVSCGQCTVGRMIPEKTHFVLGHSLIHSLIRSHCSLVCLLCTVCVTCFAHALRCAHSFVRSLTSLTPSLVGKRFFV